MSEAPAARDTTMTGALRGDAELRQREAEEL